MEPRPLKPILQVNSSLNVTALGTNHCTLRHQLTFFFPLCLAIQKEDIRVRAKKNISVTFALEEPMEEGECFGGNGSHNITEHHYNQRDNLQSQDPYAEDNPFEGNAGSMVRQRRKDRKTFPNNL